MLILNAADKQFSIEDVQFNMCSDLLIEKKYY